MVHELERVLWVCDGYFRSIYDIYIYIYIYMATYDGAVLLWQC